MTLFLKMRVNTAGSIISPSGRFFLEIEIWSHQFIFVHLISEQLIIDGLAERIPFHNTAIIALAENNLFANDSSFTIIDTQISEIPSALKSSIYRNTPWSALFMVAI